MLADKRVEPVGPRAVAPATFRLRGEVKNAERVIWDLGDNRLKVPTEPGPFDRLVVFDKPGQFPIQLIAHSGKQAVKQAAPVSVASASAGTLSAVLRVADVTTRGDRQEFAEKVAVPAKGVKTFEKLVAVRPGYTATAAKVGVVSGTALKNLKAVVSADKRSVKLSGEYAGDGKAGSDVIVPVVITQERTTTVPRPGETVSGLFGAGPANDDVLSLSVPPLPAGCQRKMTLEVRQTAADGGSRVLATVPDLKLPWKGSAAAAAGGPTAAGPGDGRRERRVVAGGELTTQLVGWDKARRGPAPR